MEPAYEETPKLDGSVPVSQLTNENDLEASDSFLEHRCDCCNGRLTGISAGARETNSSNDQHIELLYGLFDSPAPHIAFLCGLQVRTFE